ncbi:hypothetical protein ABBQ38_007177 [Trebouxia sp. C0009 RCD-2024]
MSKRPTDHLEPAAKKRGNDRQLTKDDPSDEDEEQEAHGEFAKASEDVMKKRKIVRPKRAAGALPGSSAAASGSNPFAGVSLTANPFAGVNLTAAPQTNAFAQITQQVPDSGPSVSKDITASESAKPQPASTGGAVAGTANTMDVASSASTPANHAASTSAAQSENAADAALKEAITSDATGAASSHAASADFSSFLTANKQQSPFALKAGGESTAFGSGTNGLTFGTAAGGFGALGKPGAGFGASVSAQTSTTNDGGFSFNPASTTPSGSPDAGEGTAGSPAVSAAASVAPKAVPTMPEEQQKTGEEDEHVVFASEGTLFQFDEQDTKMWRERGRGELRVNKAHSGQARLVMRQRGNFRLLLNANLWPHMPVSMMDGNKGVNFACINHAKSDESEQSDCKAPQLASFAFRKKDVGKLEELLQVIQHETSSEAGSAAATSAV